MNGLCKSPFFKVLGLFVALVFVFDLVPPDAGYSKPVERSGTETLAPYGRGVEQVADVFAGGPPAAAALGGRCLRWAGPLVESIYWLTAGVLSASLGPQYLLVALIPRAVWNLTVLMHGVAHTMLGAAGIAVTGLQNNEGIRALGRGWKFFWSESHLTERLGWRCVLVSFLPIPFLVPFLGFAAGGAASGLGVPVPEELSRGWVRAQSLGGIVLNAAALLAGAALVAAVFLVPGAVSGAWLLAGIPLLGWSLLSILTSTDDWRVFLAGRSGGRLLLSGLLGAQRKGRRMDSRQDRFEFNRVLETQVRISPMGWGKQSLGLLEDSSGYFTLQALHGLGHNDLVPALRRAMAYTRLSVGILKRIKRRRGRAPEYTSFVMDVDSSHSDEAAPAQLQPLAGWKNASATRWRLDGTGLPRRENVLWTNYVTHAGVFRGADVLGGLRDPVALRAYLQHVLDEPNYEDGPSQVIALMLDLLVTQGNWGRSLRLGYQQVPGRRFEEAFPGGRAQMLSRIPLRGLRRLLVRVFPGLAWGNPDVSTRWKHGAGAPNQYQIDRWNRIFDKAFREHLRRYGRSPFIRGPGWSKLADDFRRSLVTVLLRRVTADPSMYAAVGRDPERARAWVEKTVDAFFNQDLSLALRQIMQQSEGTFALCAGSTVEGGQLLASRGEPLAVGLGGDSRRQIVRRGWASDEDLLNLVDEDGRRVYRWVLRLDDAAGEIVRLDNRFDRLDVFSLSQNRALGPEEIEARIVDQENDGEGLVPPPIPLLNGKDPVEAALDAMPGVFDRTLEDWTPPPAGGPPPSRNLQTAEALYRRIRAKALRLEADRQALGHRNIMSRTRDIVVVGDRHNFQVAEEFVASLKGLMPDLRLRAIDATEFERHPELYTPDIDADTVVVALSHTSRRDATWRVVRQLQKIEEWAGGRPVEGGVFVVSSRWSTELTRLLGVDPAAGRFVPRVFNTFSGKIFADPTLHSPPFLLTLLELQHTLASRLLQDAAENPAAFGARPLGLACDRESLARAHAQGRKLVEESARVTGTEKSPLNSKLRRMGRSMASFASEDLRVVLVAGTFLVLSIVFHIPMPFDWLFTTFIWPAAPVLQTGFLVMGIPVWPIVVRLLDILFWETFMYYILWIVRLFFRHPVWGPKSGVSRLYMEQNGDYGASLVVAASRKLLGRVWPLSRWTVDPLKPGERPKPGSLVLASAPGGKGEKPPAQARTGLLRRVFPLRDGDGQRFEIGGSRTGSTRARDHIDWSRAVDGQADLEAQAGGWPPQARRLAQGYEATLRGVGALTTVGAMIAEARKTVRLFSNPLSLLFKRGRGHDEGEPGSLNVLQFLVQGMIGFSIIKGVLRQTLFSTAGLPVNLIFIALIVGAVLSIGSFSKLGYEWNFFKGFLLGGLWPKSSARATDEAASGPPPPEEDEELAAGLARAVRLHCFAARCTADTGDEEPVPAVVPEPAPAQWTFADAVEMAVAA